MLKLAIAAGITLSALLCGMMTLRSSGLFQNSNKNGELINDIKEIFGFPPISTNAQLSFKSEGDGSSFSFAGEGGYLPPKSISEDSDTSTADITTPVFRIFILSTATPPSLSSSATDLPSASTDTTPTSPSTSPLSTTQKEQFKEEALAEGTTVASVITSSSPPTPYAFQGNPSPAFKIELVWSTLTPPSLSNSENEVVSNDNSLKSANAGSPATLPNNNGLYLPPNKEYLPPKQ